MSFEFGCKYGLELVDRHGQVISRDEAHNLAPVEARNHIVGVVAKGTPAANQWYIGLFEGDYTPTADVTAATISLLATECTAYSETSRVPLVLGPVINGMTANTDSLAEFNFPTTRTVRGAFVCSSAPRGSTTGTLLSVVRFPSPKQLDAGTALRVTAAVVVTSIS